MSSPVDQTDILLPQDLNNSGFHQPPASLASDANNSIIAHSKHKEKDPDVEMEAGAPGSSQTPVMLTQPIESDDNEGEPFEGVHPHPTQGKEGPVKVEAAQEQAADSGSHNKAHRSEQGRDGTVAGGVSTVQFKGQPAWQLRDNGVLLIKRMTDMKLNWSCIVAVLEKKTEIAEHGLAELAQLVQQEETKDENDDYWVSQNRLTFLAKKFGVDGVLMPLLTLLDMGSSNHNMENGNTSSGGDGQGGVSVKKRNNNESHIFESPTKKAKVKMEKELDLSYYDHDLLLGNPNLPFTLKPLADDTIVNENSKVLISSLFLPYQNEVTLDEVLKNQESFLNSKDGEVLDQTVDSKPCDKLKTAENGEGTNVPHTASDSNASVNGLDGESVEKDQINIDVPIDDNGQTALHLAATLGRVSLVKELVEKGANRFRGDNDGQTSLIRVVHATNCFELSCFDKLLDLLYPAITLLDNRGRTILHHIALTCGLKGRYEASKYYLETLLEWVVKKGSKISNNSSLSLSNFICEVVNKSDKYGNTCLNYATLAGNKYIVSHLLDIGADPYKANKVGVTPGDWGIDVNNVDKSINESIILSNDKLKSMSRANGFADNRVYGDGSTTGVENNSNTNRTINDETGFKITKTVSDKAVDNGHDNFFDSSKIHNEKKVSDFNEYKESSNSLQILDSIQSFISNLGKDFKQEITQKSQQIDKLNPILRDKTLILSQKRKQYDELQKVIRTISKITNNIDNLNKAIDEEETKFQQEVKTLSINIDENNCLGNFDADQPFTIPHLYNDVEAIVEKMIGEKLKETKSTGTANDNEEDRTMNEEDEDGRECDDTITDINSMTRTKNRGANKEEIPSYLTINALKSITASDILAQYEKQLTPQKMQILKKEIPPSVVLDARIRAYEKNNQILTTRMNKKRSHNKELESQFKRIIGLCIGTETDNIDDRLLSSLLLSVENDPDPEIGQIKKVLKIVGDLDADGDGDGDTGAEASSKENRELNGLSAASTGVDGTKTS